MLLAARSMVFSEVSPACCILTRLPHLPTMSPRSRYRNRIMYYPRSLTGLVPAMDCRSALDLIVSTRRGEAYWMSSLRWVSRRTKLKRMRTLSKPISSRSKQPVEAALRMCRLGEQLAIAERDLLHHLSQLRRHLAGHGQTQSALSIPVDRPHRNVGHPQHLPLREGPEWKVTARLHLLIRLPCRHHHQYPLLSRPLVHSRLLEDLPRLDFEHHRLSQMPGDMRIQIPLRPLRLEYNLRQTLGQLRRLDHQRYRWMTRRIKSPGLEYRHR